MNCILKFILGKLLGIYLHKEFRINLFAISFDHIHVAISNLCLASWALSYISPHLIDMLHIESLYLDFECVFCIPYAVSIKLCGVSILLSQEEDQNTHENVNPCTLKASPYSSSSSSISPSCNSSSAAELVAAWIEALCSNVQIELMNATVQHSPSHLTLSLANFSSTVACTSANLNSV